MSRLSRIFFLSSRYSFIIASRLAGSLIFKNDILFFITNCFLNVFFNIVLIVIFVYVFTNFTNTTTSKTWGFKMKWFYHIFPPTSERTRVLLASLFLLDWLLLLPLAFSLYCFVFLPS